MPAAQAKEVILIVVFAVVVLASGADFVADLAHGASAGHIVKEAMVVGMSALAMAWLLAGLHGQKLEIRALRKELQAAGEAAGMPNKYVLDARRTLSDVVNQQFAEWGLTNSEKEIGWLLLKGLSLREIAMLRETLEKTVRQQASAIYHKAGINGRHAFSAWFIEDIL